MMAVVEHPDIYSIKRKALHVTRAMAPSVCHQATCFVQWWTDRQRTPSWPRAPLLDLLSVLLLTLDFVSMLSEFPHLASLAWLEPEAGQGGDPMTWFSSVNVNRIPHLTCLTQRLFFCLSRDFLDPLNCDTPSLTLLQSLRNSRRYL